MSAKGIEPIQGMFINSNIFYIIFTYRLLLLLFENILNLTSIYDDTLLFVCFLLLLLLLLF